MVISSPTYRARTSAAISDNGVLARHRLPVVVGLTGALRRAVLRYSSRRSGWGAPRYSLIFFICAGQGDAAANKSEKPITIAPAKENGFRKDNFIDFS